MSDEAREGELLARDERWLGWASRRVQSEQSSEQSHQPMASKRAQCPVTKAHPLLAEVRARGITWTVLQQPYDTLIDPATSTQPTPENTSPRKQSPSIACSIALPDAISQWPPLLLLRPLVRPDRLHPCQLHAHRDLE